MVATHYQISLNLESICTNNKRKEEEDTGADVDSIDEDSAESTLEELYDLDMDIASTKNDIATVQDGKAKSKKALCSEAGRSK